MFVAQPGNKEAGRVLARDKRTRRSRFVWRWVLGVGVPCGLLAGIWRIIDRTAHAGPPGMDRVGYAVYALVSGMLVSVTLAYAIGRVIWVALGRPTDSL